MEGCFHTDEVQCLDMGYHLSHVTVEVASPVLSQDQEGAHQEGQKLPLVLSLQPDCTVQLTTYLLEQSPALAIANSKKALVSASSQLQLHSLGLLKCSILLVYAGASKGISLVRA